MIVSEDERTAETRAGARLPSDTNRAKIHKSLSNNLDPGKGENDDSTWTLQKRRLAPS
jgi:hypothetical protein